MVSGYGVLETMKLKNRIMAALLSPGAYALWHSMGNPEEWEWRDDGKEPYFRHKGSHLKVCMDLWWRIPGPCYLFPFLWWIPLLSWAFNPIWIYCVDQDEGLGICDRFLIAGRAARLRGRIIRHLKNQQRRKSNSNILAALTVNEVSK